MTQTVIALFDDFDSARRAVEALVEAGYSRDVISLVANDVVEGHSRYVNTEDVKGSEGAGFGAVVGTLIGLGTALIPGVGPVLAAGPAWAALMAGIGAASGAATGGITASLIDLGITEERAGYYAEGVRRGGALVSATVNDASESHVRSILDQHGAADIQHRSSYYQETGYAGYNPANSPYTREQIEEERQRYRSTSTTNR